MKKVIFIGYKTDAITYCLKNDIQPIVLVDQWDEPEYLPSKRDNEIRLFINDTSNDFFNLSELLSKGIKKVDAVISLYEYTQFNGAFLADFYKCLSFSILTAVNFRDKRIQKSLVREVYRTANVYSITDIIDNAPICYPLVIKPTSGTGTQLIKVIHDRESCIKEFKKIKNKSDRYTNVMIEEFINGEEYYVDGWISEGKIRQFTISKYVNPLREIQNGKITQGVTLTITDYQALYSLVLDMLEKVLLKLELKNGVFHLEFFKEEMTDDIIFSECACRLGGVSPEVCFKENFEIDLYDVLIRLSMGETVGSKSEIGPTRYTGMTYLPIPYSQISYLPDLLLFQRVCGDFVVDVKYDWEIGQAIPNLEESTSEKIGIVTVRGASYDNVINNLEIVRQEFSSMLKIPSRKSSDKKSNIKSLDSE